LIDLDSVIILPFWCLVNACVLRKHFKSSSHQKPTRWCIFEEGNEKGENWVGAGLHNKTKEKYLMLDLIFRQRYMDMGPTLTQTQQRPTNATIYSFLSTCHTAAASSLFMCAVILVRNTFPCEMITNAMAQKTPSLLLQFLSENKKKGVRSTLS
jgi:hypothetical protein